MFDLFGKPNKNKYNLSKLYSIIRNGRIPSFVKTYINEMNQAKKEALQETLDEIDLIAEVPNRMTFVNNILKTHKRKLEAKIIPIIDVYKANFDANQNRMSIILQENERIRQEEIKKEKAIRAQEWLEQQKEMNRRFKIQEKEREISSHKRHAKAEKKTPYKASYRNYHTNSNYNVSGSSGYGSTSNEGYWTNEGNRPQFVKTGTIKHWKHKSGKVAQPNNSNYISPIKTRLPRNHYNSNYSGSN